MATYSKANAEVLELVDTVMGRYHGGLKNAGVRIQVLMAHPATDDNGDPTGPALRVNGYRALACIRILGLKDRVARGFDAEMSIDFEHWTESSDEEQEAIIDHELTHLELVTGDDGAVKRDDADRPRLRARKHDWQFGWFDTVAARHGENSIEIQQCRQMVTHEYFRQTYLFDMEEAVA